MSRTGTIVSIVVAAVLAATAVEAEPMFLSRQYNRCTSCHYSAGGGLLTPYGRSLSRQELSTTGRSPAGATPGAPGTGEEAFLFGALGDKLGPLSLGFDTRPSHLHIDTSPTPNRDFFMNADLWAAWRAHGWTVYGELGRQPTLNPPSSKIDSYEYWVGYESEKGLGFRVGRFFPAFGVNFADHTDYSRTPLQFNSFDQVYGVELSRSGERNLIQVSLGPGHADPIIHENTSAFTATARFQRDLNTRTVLAVSGIYRASTDLLASERGGGLAFGISPVSHLTIWTEGDVIWSQGQGTPEYVLVNETSLELFRGFWLKVSPQLLTAFGDTSGGSWRIAFEADFLPRTHWHLSATYYRDESRSVSFVTKTFIAQLHLYL